MITNQQGSRSNRYENISRTEQGQAEWNRDRQSRPGTGTDGNRTGIDRAEQGHTEWNRDGQNRHGQIKQNRDVQNGIGIGRTEQGWTERNGVRLPPPPLPR